MSSQAGDAITDRTAYLIAARRTALGRPGGLHARKRLEDLTAPVVAAILSDAGISASDVDDLIVGNTTASGNPARLIALTAGLNPTTPAITLNRDACSGLDAILQAMRQIDRGTADVVIAGGAEALSTADWRVARPHAPSAPPRFLEIAPKPGFDIASGEANGQLRAMENLSRQHQVQRTAQDLAAARTGEVAREAFRDQHFAAEIVALDMTPGAKTDENLNHLPTAEQIIEMPALDENEGTVTQATAAFPHDGAAMAVIVSEQRYEQLGRPPALKLIADATVAAAPGSEADAPAMAASKVFDTRSDLDRARLSEIALSEASYAQLIAFADCQQFPVEDINPYGGDVCLGHAVGASGAVLTTRLFHDFAAKRKNPGENTSFQGLVIAGAASGTAVAALFETVNWI